LKSLGLREDSLPGGKGDETTTKQVDKNQLEMGIKVEMEHTKDPNLAREIAMDHLTEDPQYYTKLKDAGIADELQGGKLGEAAPKTPMMSKLISPTAIMPTPVIAVGVRGTRSGGLPAGGRVDDPEKARLGGWEKMKVLPQGGVVGDPEKARLGGLERVTNLKPNSQGAISDTPASDEIKAKGGHYTPENPEITKGKTPKTSKKGDDAIHPFQTQQLGNEPFEDDGTTRDGEKSPPAATAGIEGGSAPDSEPEQHPHATTNDVPTTEPEETPDSTPEKEEEPRKGPWGIEMDDEEEEEEKEKDDEEGKDVSIDIKETLDAAKATVAKECATCGCGKPNTMHPMGEGWAMGEYTPEQQRALALLTKKGFREVSTFPAEPDAEGGNMGEQVVIVVQKKIGIVRYSGEIDPSGLVNGQPVEQFIAGTMREGGTMKDRFQQLANINNEAGALSELRELVGRLNSKGTVTPLLAKAQKYLAEIDTKQKQ